MGRLRSSQHAGVGHDDGCLIAGAGDEQQVRHRGPKSTHAGVLRGVLRHRQADPRVPQLHQVAHRGLNADGRIHDDLCKARVPGVRDAQHGKFRARQLLGFARCGSAADDDHTVHADGGKEFVGRRKARVRDRLHGNVADRENALGQLFYQCGERFDVRPDRGCCHDCYPLDVRGSRHFHTEGAQRDVHRTAGLRRHRRRPAQGA